MQLHNYVYDHRHPYLYDYGFNGSCMAAYGRPVDPNLVLGDFGK